MRKIFVLAFVAISFASCQNATKTNETASTATESAAVAGASTEAAVPAGDAAVMDFEKEITISVKSRKAKRFLTATNLKTQVKAL